MNQKARDFAETALRLMPATQPATIQLRTGLGWLCYADAFHRTGNALAALRCLTCASLCWSHKQPSLPLFFRALRLRTLVLRDLHLTELAHTSLQAERTLAARLGLSAQIEEQLTQVEVTIALLTELSPEQALQLLRKIDAVLATPRAETAPLLACAANLIAHLCTLNATVPDDLSQHFNEQLQHVGEPVRTLLATLAQPDPHARKPRSGPSNNSPEPTA